MASLMLVNPRKRRKAKAHTAKRRVTAHRRKRTVSRKRRTYASNPIAVNPIRRTKRHTRRKYRRNPIGGKGLKGIMAPLMPATISAVGAIGLDLAWGMIGSKLPATLTGGPVKYVAKAAGALALGALAGMVLKKDTANQMAIGALTVVLHSAMRDTLSQVAPNVQLGDADGVNGLAEYFPDAGMNGMGEYMMDGIGYAGAGVSFDPFNEELNGLGAGEYPSFVI